MINAHDGEQNIYIWTCYLWEGATVVLLFVLVISMLWWNLLCTLCVQLFFRLVMDFSYSAVAWCLFLDTWFLTMEKVTLLLFNPSIIFTFQFRVWFKKSTKYKETFHTSLDLEHFKSFFQVYLALSRSVHIDWSLSPPPSPSPSVCHCHCLGKSGGASNT